MESAHLIDYLSERPERDTVRDVPDAVERKRGVVRSGEPLPASSGEPLPAPPDGA